MLRRSKRNAVIGVATFVFSLTILWIANIHKNIRYVDELLKTQQKYAKIAHFKANNTFSLKKVGLDFRKLYESICPARDTFEDLREAIEYIESKIPLNSNTKEPIGLQDFFTITSEEKLTVLDKFNLAITSENLYSNDSQLVEDLLHEMATRKIVRVDEKHGGTQFKLKITFDNGMRALVKPKRFPRDQPATPNHGQFAEFESSSSEIAAFHLDRILGFRRAMPVVGRFLNMTSEIIALAKPNLTDTFFISPQPYENHCLLGNCMQYCTIDHPICGDKDMLETAFIAYMPYYFAGSGFHLDEKTSPWRRSYNEKRKTIWERDPKYCERLKKTEPYKEGRLLLDLMDMNIFDFLTGNRDRHSYSKIKFFENDTFIIHFDNGRSFGRPFYDEELTLLAISQCCVIRSTTLKTLLNFQNGPKPLSQLMHESMASDPAAPILWEAHLKALDRRVNILLKTFQECIELNTIENVIYSRDNFGEQTSNFVEKF